MQLLASAGTGQRECEIRQGGGVKIVEKVGEHGAFDAGDTTIARCGATLAPAPAQSVRARRLRRALFETRQAWASRRRASACVWRLRVCLAPRVRSRRHASARCGATRAPAPTEFATRRGFSRPARVGARRRARAGDACAARFEAARGRGSNHAPPPDFAPHARAVSRPDPLRRGSSQHWCGFPARPAPARIFATLRARSPVPPRAGADLRSTGAVSRHAPHWRTGAGRRHSPPRFHVTRRRGLTLPRTAG